MSNPTSNFNWQMPTNTDLVSQLPADFEVFGQAVDTALMDLKGGTTGQVLKKNTDANMDFVWAADTAGMTNPMTTTGDTIYSSSGSTPARLGIGSTGNVLTVAGGVPTWAAPAGSGANWSLLNAGGTALTGAQTVTVSGISGKDKIMIILETASSADSQAIIGIRLNADTDSNYYTFGLRVIGTQTYEPSISTNLYVNTSYYRMGRLGQAEGQALNGYCLITGCDSAGLKIINAAAGISTGGSYGQEGTVAGGYYNGSSSISSISVFSSAGNLDNGTVYVYASA